MKPSLGETIPAYSFKHAGVQRLVNEFIASLRSHQAETRGTYNRALREFLRWLPADQEFRFSPEGVWQYRLYIAGERKLAGASVSTYLTALRSFCTYLIGIGLLDENPVHQLGGQVRPAVQPPPVMAGEVADRLLSVIPQAGEIGARDYAIVLLMLRCGLSGAGIVRVDVNDYRVDSSGASIRLKAKSGRTRESVVTLPPEVRGAMEKYLSLRIPGEAHTPLFRSAGNRTRGMRMTSRGIRSRINEHIEAAGIKRGQSQRITPRFLRHSLMPAGCSNRSITIDPAPHHLSSRE